MPTRLERLVELMAGLERIEDAMARELPNLKRELRVEIDRERRETLTRSMMGAGMPCAAEFAWLGGEEPVQPPDASDSSAAIPEERVKHIDACGE